MIYSGNVRFKKTLLTFKPSKIAVNIAMPKSVAMPAPQLALYEHPDCIYH